MTGYLNNPEATAITFDDEGYLHTGDVAEVTEEGVFTIVDRVKELIKYKGYQVPPAELEALLLTHDQVADVAVIGVRDDEGEEVPKAFVVRQAGAELTAEEVMDLRRRADRAAQEGAGGGVHRADPEVGLGQDPAQGPARSRGRVQLMDCLLCRIVARTEEASIVYEDDRVVAICDLYPVNPGHLLVITKAHAVGLDDLDATDGCQMFAVAQRLAAALRRTDLRCEGINLFLADGEAAFQEVFHVHLHVIPRYIRDEFKLNSGQSTTPTARQELDAIAAQVSERL